MPGSIFQLERRPATVEHAGLVADLESARDPNEPRDPVLLRHWWRMADELEKTKRYIDVRDGAAVAYVAVSHELWNAGEKRFGVVRTRGRRDKWSRNNNEEMISIGGDWIQNETADTAVARVREDFPDEIAKN